VDFARDIQPIFARSCSGCHGAASQKNGLRLDSGEAVLRGGHSGAVVVPRDSSHSRLVTLVSTGEGRPVLPPAGPRLTAAQVGLPPSPAEVIAFLDDRRPDAYERLVDRLLASPHYGEHWGRWWLDAARYADTNGYEKDNQRSIWLYRDWVIDALNRDLPFDQ